MGLRIDVDTHQGLRDGVPRLLEILRAATCRASFFFSMGPDNAGRAILNLMRPGFLSKMLRTRAPGLYGWRTVLSGTLLPARPIGTAFAELIEECAQQGHEVGVHCWDHRFWQDRLDAMSASTLRRQLDLGRHAFRELIGQPSSFAAPAWLTRPEALLHQETFELTYASDCRGRHPFLPRVGGCTLETPQVPANLATLDEMLGRLGPDGRRKDAAGFFSDTAREASSLAAPVLTVHAEAEGNLYARVFRDFLETSRGSLRFSTLGELLETYRTENVLGVFEVERGAVPGRHGVVSKQGRAR